LLARSIQRLSQRGLRSLGLLRSPRSAGLACLVLIAGVSLIPGDLSAQLGTGDGPIQDLEITADETDYDQTLGIAKAAGNVTLNFGDVTIKADEVEYHQSSGLVFARGEVRVFTAGEVIDAEEVIYNVQTGELTTSNLASAMDPIFYTTENVVRPEDESGGPIILSDSTFTTHDSQNPNWRIEVRELEVHPGKKVIMRGANVYAGNRKVFWFPILCNRSTLSWATTSPPVGTQPGAPSFSTSMDLR
ncbi:MAG: LptA/OstA family protein, partial [Verrucomicrobiota bacterium]